LLDADPLYELFPVIGRVTEQQLGGLGTLEVKVCVVLPGEADPAVDLYGFARGVEVSLGAVRLGQAGDDRDLLLILGHRPRRLAQQLVLFGNRENQGRSSSGYPSSSRTVAMVPDGSGPAGRTFSTVTPASR